MAEKKLFLLDAYALIFRAYYAFIKNPRINSKGLNTSAIFGFANSLDEILKKEKPTHIAVAFDPPHGTFRHEMYEAYKANRDETPEDIKKAMPYIKRMLEGFKIPIIEVPGFEADDVIGTIAKKAEAENFVVYMMTPDKDFGQLVSDSIFMYKPSRAGGGVTIVAPENMEDHFGISSPQQVIDMLGLMGDKADNIPGCPGIGEKTAIKLISEFGSIDGIYENIECLKGKIRENLQNFREQVMLSKELATIKTDVPYPFSESDLEIEIPYYRILNDLFDELEFRTLKERILGAKPEPSNQNSKQEKVIQGSLFDFQDDTESTLVSEATKSLKDLECNYYLVDNEMARASLRAELSVSEVFCFDTETSSVDPLLANLVGMSFSSLNGVAYYVPVPADYSEACALVMEFNLLFGDKKILKVGQNIKYDIQVLEKYGAKISGKIFDTMIAHYLLQPDLRHNMDFMAEVYLNYKTIHIDELIGTKGKNQGNMADLEPEKIKDYACEDADITLQLYHILSKKLREEKLEELFYKLEMPLVFVLSDMEKTGVKLDISSLKNYSEVLVKNILALEDEITSLAGFPFNIGSPKQVGEVLFDHLKIDTSARKTKSGQYSTSEEVLQRLKNYHPIVEKILDYRGLKKLLSTYVEALPLLINPDTGKIHTSYNQTVAATGRLSSNNPNLQNIPIRDSAGREIRKAFIPNGEDHIFLSADYSQVELRLMAHLSEDKAMIEAFNNGEDIHTATAAKVFKVSPDEVTSDMRRKAKTANFGIIYGISAFGLSERLNISRKEAKELIDGYFATYHGVHKYMEKCIARARDIGYVETIFGRKRILQDINSRNQVVRGVAERNAINAPIQGSAADIIKVAMINIYNRLKQEKLKAKMILQVHDELVFDLPESEREVVTNLVIHEMENAVKLRVPLIADYGYGKDWLEAH